MKGQVVKTKVPEDRLLDELMALMEMGGKTDI